MTHPTRSILASNNYISRITTPDLLCVNALFTRHNQATSAQAPACGSKLHLSEETRAFSSLLGCRALTIIRKRLYRIYYTVFDDKTHRRIVEELEKRYGKVVEHKSIVHPEFHYLELFNETPGLEDEIASTVKAIAGVMGVKVDWIEIKK